MFNPIVSVSIAISPLIIKFSGKSFLKTSILFLKRNLYWMMFR
jgi:hypothetical protein